MNILELSIMLAFIVIVGIVGFYASKFKPSLTNDITEWSLGGRHFGTFIVWFLIGGDVYTAYTLIAIPGLAYGAGVLALFATSYVIMTYPIVFLTMPRLWNVAKRHDFITAGDYVEKVFDSKFLALIVGIIGILAELPYIGLQIFGMNFMLSVTHVPSNITIIISLLLVMGFTVFNGLRAPALTAFIKDFFVWAMVLFLIIYIPIHYFGSIGHMFSWFNAHYPKKAVLAPGQISVFATLAFGSAAALFLYPHAITGVYSSKNANTVRKNAIVLPIYNIMLLFITLLGFAALFVVPGLKNPNMAFPMLISKTFGPILTALIGAIIILGSMIPASIMSIASANLFTRNIYKNLINPNISDSTERIISKVSVAIIILLALYLSLAMSPSFIITLQLIAGSWVVQLFPLIFLPLFTNRVSKIPAGIATIAGIVLTTYILYLGHFKLAVYKGIWAGLYGIAIEIVVLLVLTFLFKPMANISLDDYLDD
ncbi:sodium:solute symporter [Desulfurella sp.]|uniref:sodium:solute symporter family protein n=1 Tax=Desulfurella sp. TaxID=1962857 RepID=UPI0025B9F3D5|nr:sodium:solute symporter family protein [Desulfurella sp.]